MTEPFVMPPFEEADPEGYAKAVGWPEIAKLGNEEVELPEFPVKLLPPVLAEMVSQVAAEVQAPLGLAAMMVLPIAGANLAGKIVFEAQRGWSEHAMIWTITAAATSERKTPVFKRLRSPLDEAAQTYHEEWIGPEEVRQAELDAVLATIKAVRDGHTKNFTDGTVKGMSDQLQEELKKLVQQRAQLEKPIYRPCPWVTNPTPEGLHVLASETGGRVAILSDEGGIVGTIAGRYGSGGGADLDPLLSGHVGGPLRTPRAGSARKDIDAMHLTIGLAVQPSVLDELCQVKGVEERGLLGRFLYARPNSLVGTRFMANSVPVDDEVAARYRRELASWANWPGMPDGYVTIELSDEARKVFIEFADSIERRIGKDQVLHGMNLVSKFPGNILRIAGLFHCYGLGRYEALDQPIGVDHMTDAIELAETYFLPQILDVTRKMRSAPDDNIEARILSKIRREGWREFKRRDLLLGIKGNGGVQKTADIIEPLENLVEDGYLRKIEKEGQKSTTAWFESNPAIFS